MTNNEYKRLSYAATRVVIDKHPLAFATLVKQLKELDPGGQRGTIRSRALVQMRSLFQREYREAYSEICLALRKFNA
jgi:hypothetical protein